MSNFEYIGCGFGLLGALLLSLNCKHSGWGFVAFLVSNVSWITFAIQNGINGLLVMQFGFTITSLIGIYRWRKTLITSTNETL
jgi:nicotinamide riboside transporter PnuC